VHGAESTISPLALRAAIVHDWFQGYHGAERVADVMRRDLFMPGHEADVFTFHAARELLPPELNRAIIRESLLAQLPGIRQRGHRPGRWRYLLPYMPLYYRRLDLSAYELVISSSHACAVNARPRADALHVVYCYTPMRYAWMRATDGRRMTGLRGGLLRGVTGGLRAVDRRAARRPDAFIAISSAVQERIRRFYGRESTVIHPPVDVEDFDRSHEKEPGRFLWVHRLVPYKEPLLVAEAFRGLPQRLTMVGIGPLETRLRATLPPNVELRSWVSREELAHLYASASGFIHIGEEDFGITMVESLASGTPVIALDRGGARDIVRADIDGILIESPELETLRRAIEEATSRSWDASALALRARDFSRGAFVRRMLEYIHALGGPAPTRGSTRTSSEGDGGTERRERWLDPVVHRSPKEPPDVP
jgi:glycosyltransferase involved in cell wall biosynthesis